VRIALVSAPAGQTVHVAELAHALARGGHDVRLYTRRDRPDPPDPAPAAVDVVRVPAGPPQALSQDALLPHMGAFGQWLADTWLAGTWVPDVVHAHFWTSGLAALTARRRSDVPVVLTYHGLGVVERRHQGEPDSSPAGRIGYERILGQRADRVVAQSQDEVRELVEAGVPRRRIVVVPSGVDHRHFAPDGPFVPRDADRPRVLAVGRFVARKGFREIVRAMRRVPDAELVIVGGPPSGGLRADPFARHLRELADTCGIGDRLRLVGAVPRADLPSWYRSGDVLVAAPWHEPVGPVPLEAMACGVPVIGAAVGGLVDTIVDGVCGDLVPPRDPRALGAAIRDLLDDPVRRLSYSAGAVDRARSVYSWESTADRLSAVYAAVQPRTTRVVA
jgi:glycosyltransferase involved in cell wall biosynthesis